MKVTKETPFAAVPERVVPAQPAWTERRTEVICDICETHRHYQKCAICNRDLCKSCTIYDPRDNSDYPNRWCPVCLKLWNEKYDAANSELESDYDDAAEALWDEWKAASLGQSAKAAKGANDG